MARRRYETIRRRAEDVAERAVANRLSLALSIGAGLAMIGAGVALVVIEALPGSGLAGGISVGVAGLVVLLTLGYAIARSARHPLP